MFAKVNISLDDYSFAKVLEGKEEAEVPGVIVVKQREAQRSESPAAASPATRITAARKEIGIVPLLQPTKGITNRLSGKHGFSRIFVLGVDRIGRTESIYVFSYYKNRD